jgi:hypothetical protein
LAGELTVWSPYIAALEQERAELIDGLEPHVHSEAIEPAQRLSARLSVRLDASPLDDATAEAVDRGWGEPGEGERQRAGGWGEPGEGVMAAARNEGAGWAHALKLDGMPTQDIAAMEYRGVRAAQMDEAGLASGFFADPVGTLMRLQRHIAGGLVSEDRLGTLRSTSRAVTDGAQGMVIFQAPDPRRIPGLLEDLDRWVRAARDRHPPLVVAGLVHLRLLHWQPFETGNGRVARAASRVALRATVGDPWGVAVPELVYAHDPRSYVAEVAATIRRRSDLSPWIERTGEAMVASLETLARDVGVAPPTVPARGMHECQRLQPGETITVPEYETAVDSDRMTAIAQLNRLCWTGLLERDAGTHGLRFVRR